MCVKESVRVCVHVRVCACVRARVCTCVYVRVRVHLCVYLYVCVHTYTQTSFDMDIETRGFWVSILCLETHSSHFEFRINFLVWFVTIRVPLLGL